MPLSALLLVLLAAAMHASWNLILKQVEERQLFTWWALVVGTLLSLPILIISGPPPMRIWPYAIISAIVETAYFITLIRAYRIGDFSLVYPIARGTAPALLAVWATLFLGERPNLVGISGLVALLIGLSVVGSGPFLTASKQLTPSRAAFGMALIVSLFISIYSAIDGAAVRVMPAAPYTVLVLGLTALFSAPAIFIRFGSNSLLEAGRKHWGRILLVGILIMLTYILVLQAFALGHVIYAGALRESSVVIAALIGWLWLGESYGSIRTLGSVLIFIGILLIAMAK